MADLYCNMRIATRYFGFCWALYGSMKSSLPISLFFIILLIWPCLSEAESSPLVTFVNGEIADAEDINSNFDNHEQRLTAIEQYGGCSASQDGSNVVISCADGTSGLLAGAGTVVVYPEGGITGDSPMVSWSTGAVIFEDANGVVLGKAESKSSTVIRLNGSVGTFFNDAGNEQVLLTGWGGGEDVYYLSNDCTGQIFILASSSSLIEISGELFVADEAFSPTRLLFESKRRSGSANFTSGSYIPAGSCRVGQIVADSQPVTTYTPAPEILNAAYPVKLVQLP